MACRAKDEGSLSFACVICVVNAMFIYYPTPQGSWQNSILTAHNLDIQFGILCACFDACQKAAGYPSLHRLMCH